MIACDGTVRMYVSIVVSAEEMAEWSPERIRAFFRGLARAVSAKNGVWPKTPAQEDLLSAPVGVVCVSCDAAATRKDCDGFPRCDSCGPTPAQEDAK